MKTTVVISALLALLPLALASCGSGGITCDDESMPSLKVFVEDGEGIPVPDADVSASYDGEVTTCLSNDDGQYDCDYNDVIGTFTLTASKEGHVETTADVTVEGDECHVITADATLVLVEEEFSCCCAYMKQDDDTMTEELTPSEAECLELDQGSCIDASNRPTPHACCPDAPGESCG